jgi:predicted PurR-regulated permease PerM
VETAAGTALPVAAVPADRRSGAGGGLALIALAMIALVGALYLARGFFVPLLIGILASYALRPLVDRLAAWRLPRSVGAALVLAVAVGGVSWVGLSISDDAEALIKKLPEAARKLRDDLNRTRASAPSALQNVQKAAQEIEGAAADAGAPASTGAKPRRAAVAVAAAEPTWLRDFTLSQYTLIVTVLAQAPVVLLLTYFLLASGAHFRRKLLQLVGPSLSRKKEAVGILEEIDSQVQLYLLATLASNALLAAATWLAFLALGLEQPAVWGVAAGVLHFVPYLGPSLIALGSGVAAFLQFGSLPWALAVAGASLVIAGLIGLVFMTWLQGRVARINAAVLFIALLFFGWLWGIWGLLLGAPLVAIVKVVFDRVESLKPAGELLGH